jgi:hypothetical protein
MIRRVFFYSGFRMKVFEWQGRELLGSYEFDPDSEGIAEFNEYLTKATPVPAQLLVDLVEEDFRREVIPHVNASDRKAITTRLLDRHYRGEHHIHVQIVSRDKLGRKDDTLLLSALINNDILEPWLMHLQEHNVPLAGIWSLPLISEKLISAVTKNERHVMFVSQQISTAQRESYFAGGKLMLSRQAKLDRNRRDRRDRRNRRNEYQEQDRRHKQGRRDEGSITPLAEQLLGPKPDTTSTLEEHGVSPESRALPELDRRQQDDRRIQEDRRMLPALEDVDHAVLNIQKGVEQIHIFLTNQRIMGFTDKLFVYCLLPNDLVEETGSMIKDTNAIHYKCINLDDLFKFYKLENCVEQEADTLFAFLCSSMPLAPDHYAQVSEKKSYRRYQLDQFIALASTVASFILLLSACLLWLNSTELNQEQHRVDTQRGILERRYQNDYAPIQQRLTDAATVQATVLLAQRLQAEAQQSPEQFFAPLSTVFSDSRFEDIQLDDFAWQKYLPAELHALLKAQQATVTEPLPEGQVAEEAPAEEQPVDSKAPALLPALELKGYLHRGSRSYRETVELMNTFAEALRKIPRVTQVVIVKMPVDIRPALSFSDEAGTEEINADNLMSNTKEKEMNQYEIVVGFGAEVVAHD